MEELEGGAITLTNHREFCALSRAVRTINEAKMLLESMRIEIDHRDRLVVRFDQVVLSGI